MFKVSRRDVAFGALAALVSGSGQAGAASRTDGAAFSRDRVLDEARRLASEPFAEPTPLPQELVNLDYSTYRAISYRRDAAVWGRSPTRFSIQMFAPGSVYIHPVDVLLVESGQARPAPVTVDAFQTPSPEIARLLADVGRLAGFRLHYPVNRDGFDDEFLVFQGASYFRAVSRGQFYGLSARGLAVGVAEPRGEEFPFFRTFWIERPSATAESIVVHALLDSRSCTGAYRFGICPGAPTTIDVEATLFPRVQLDHVGLGCLTSMFMHGPIDPPERADFRPSVHDSLGLAIHAGNDERIWRPLNNPRALQISAFVDHDPKGFGLVQRPRAFNEYQDLEARYERRPSAWVRPDGAWGAGHIQLVEIPSDHEGNDNIVAYWRPADPLPAGQPFVFAYRLTWPDDAGPGSRLAEVRRSAYGRALGSGHPQIVIDYSNPRQIPIEAITLDLSARAEAGLTGHVAEHQVTGGFRVYLDLNPRDSAPVEIAVRPRVNGEPAGETWLYRWTSRG